MTGLYLELPYGNVDSYAKRAAVSFEVLDGYFGERNSFTLANLVVDAVEESVSMANLTRPFKELAPEYPLRKLVMLTICSKQAIKLYDKEAMLRCSMSKVPVSILWLIQRTTVGGTTPAVVTRDHMIFRRATIPATDTREQTLLLSTPLHNRPGAVGLRLELRKLIPS